MTVSSDCKVKRRACSGTSAGKLLVAPPSHLVAPTAPTNCARRSSPNRHRHRGTDIEFGTIFPPGPIVVRSRTKYLRTFFAFYEGNGADPSRSKIQPSYTSASLRSIRGVELVTHISQGCGDMCDCHVLVCLLSLYSWRFNDSASLRASVLSPGPMQGGRCSCPGEHLVERWV